MADDSNREQAYGGQTQQRELASSGATKSAGASEGTKSAAGAPSRPVSVSYGNSDGQTEGEQKEEQQQQQQQDDGYGAAPMGQAEPFAFNYKTQDNYGNEQYRREESDKNGVVRGSYGYMDQSGIFRHVEYVADENGFRANVKSNEPGLSNEQAPGSQDSKQRSSSQSPGVEPVPTANEPAAGGPMMGVPPTPVAPPSSSSSLAGSSGMGDASLRLQEQQQQQDTQMPMTPLMDMMQQVAGASQQPEREMQQQQQKQYGAMSDNGRAMEK